jgi:hypothetical protein
MNSEGHHVLSCKTSVAELIDDVYFRYRRQKRDGTTTKQGGQRSRVFNNGAFTNDYVNTGKVIPDKEIPSKLMMIHQIIFHSIDLKISRLAYSRKSIIIYYLRETDFHRLFIIMSLSNKPRITVCVAGQILNECTLSCIWLEKTDIE